MPDYLLRMLVESMIFLTDENGLELCISYRKEGFAHAISQAPRARRLIASAKECGIKGITILAESGNFCRTLSVQQSEHFEPTPLVQNNQASMSFKIMPHLNTEQQVLERRAERHKPLLQAIGQGVVAVTMHDAHEESGFAYLDVFAPLTERLNKQRHELIGRSVESLPAAIAEPRLHALRKAVAVGGHVSYSYSYEDDYKWRFNVEVAPLWGTEEIITIVRDAEVWQPGHWLNKRKQMNR